MNLIADPARLLRELDGAAKIVFDLDGTLYDTRDFERPALASVARRLREFSGQPLETLHQDLWQRRESNRHNPRLFDEVLAEYKLPAAWRSECVQLFRDYAGTELSSAQSLAAELRQLRERGTRLALVSNGHTPIQERKLRMLALSELFDVSIFCDPRVPDRLKPSAWAWSQLIQWQAGEQCVHVGDDPVDAGFASAGGARYVPFNFRSSSYEN